MGRPLSEETKRKIGDANRGKVKNQVWRKNLGLAHIGKITSHETRKKISDALKEKYPPKFSRELIERWYWGKEYSIRDMSRIYGFDETTFLRWMKRYGIPRREKHMWHRDGFIGNVSEYRGFTVSLKDSIKNRDGHVCIECDDNSLIHVHHIDYDKTNNCPSNLISLCRTCHGRTNFNRDYWMGHFRDNTV